jgi:hypothetical protein
MTQLTHSALYGDECRRLKAEGLRQFEIAKRVGISGSSVRYILADPAQREFILAQKRGGKSKTAFYGYHHTPKAAMKPVKLPPPVAITKEAKDAACLAFARGDIARDELMRRITPRDKWRDANMGEP